MSVGYWLGQMSSVALGIVLGAVLLWWLCGWSFRDDRDAKKKYGENS